MFSTLHEFLTSIQQKPKHIRGQYAFWSSLILTMSIVFIWGLFQKDRFTVGTSKEQETVMETESSFFSELGEIFGAVRNIPNMFKGKVEYNKEVEVKVVVPKTIDLDALVASSTRALRERVKVASPTDENSVHKELP